MALENTFDNEEYRTLISKIFSGLTTHCQRKQTVYLILKLLILYSKIRTQRPCIYWQINATPSSKKSKAQKTLAGRETCACLSTRHIQSVELMLPTDTQTQHTAQEHQIPNLLRKSRSGIVGLHTSYSQQIDTSTRHILKKSFWFSKFCIK